MVAILWHAVNAVNPDAPKVPKGKPLNWPDPAVEDAAKPALPQDADEAAAAYRRDAKRKRPGLLDAQPE
jgi:hypothetical protein